MTRPLQPVSVGFVPLLDAALLIVAKEEGFAEAEGIALQLHREGSWAAVRDKLNARLFDAAHMLAPAAVASTLGLGHLRVPLACPVALSLDGNAITVSQALAAELAAEGGARLAEATPAHTAAWMARLVAERKAQGREPFTAGVVFGYSCHLYQLRSWLKLGGLDPEADLRFVVIPPPLMAESLAAGHLDLFCAGAPWNRLAESLQAGTVLHPCRAIEPDCLEKVLAVREDRLDAVWLPGLVRALLKAAAWSAEPRHWPILARLLSRPDYVGVAAGLIEPLIAGQDWRGAGPAAPWLRIDPAAAAPDPARSRACWR